MHYGLLAVILSLFSISINAPDKEIRNDWQKYYKKYNVEGSFVLYDMNKDKYYIYNDKRANTEFLPASTFKIFNSLTALETKVIKDENEVLKWDGAARPNEMWNRDHDMKSAIKYSVVWFYQELARRIGRERMQHYIDTVNYGNRDIRDSIDNFWLTGKLRITPMQQIEFLKKLYKNDLPFSQRSIDIVKDILINEKSNDFILRAKTGWAEDVGWWVGYIETKENVYFFVNNIQIINDADAAGRIEIAKNILHDMGIYP